MCKGLNSLEILKNRCELLETYHKTNTFSEVKIWTIWEPANIFKSENLSNKELTNVSKSVKPDYTQLALPMVLLPIKSIFIVEATKNTRSMESCFGKS